MELKLMEEQVVDLMSKRWGEEWETVEGPPERSGGQGTVTKVRHRVGGPLGALKQMHPRYISDTERRRRMAREVKALRQVAGTGIPAILDDNVSFAEDTSVPLYFVSEWVEGETLQSHVTGKPQSLEGALRITRELAEIVGRCHAANVHHRDIKPDNVIIRKEDAHPVLVDFGTAWAEAEGSRLRTEAGQELGNRFLRIPDLSAGRERRDLRADVTFLIGILFFLITGRHPRVLVDQDGLPPHDAMEHLIPETTTSDRAWVLVRRILDVGFQAAVGFRFQSADELIERLDEVLDPPEPGEPISRYREEVEAYRDLVNSTIARSVQRVEEGYPSGL